MTDEHIINRIGRLVYGHDNIKSYMARDLGISRQTLDNWLNNGDLSIDIQLRQQLIGYIDMTVRNLESRRDQLNEIADALRDNDQ